LQIEKIHAKNKKITEKWSLKVDVSGVGLSQILKTHLTIGDDLAHSIP
jgi:hypothetical protein